jgi:hypothetical protein
MLGYWLPKADLSALYPNVLKRKALPQCPETKASHPESSIAQRGSAAAISAMDKREAKLLFERCLPKFVEAGLQVISDISDVKVKEIASLWAGMGPLAEPSLSCLVMCFGERGN